MRGVAIALAAALATVAAAQTFRVDVKLVRIVATVKDASGNPVGDLAKDRFRITDSNVVQEIASLDRSTAQPLSIALLIDTSGSTANDLPSEAASIKTFLKVLLREGNPQDAASIYAFNYEVNQLVPFTRREGRLRDALGRLKGEAGTSVYDAIHFAARDLDARTGRRVMVLVTDGGDTTSSFKFRDALRAAHDADAVVYPVLIQPIKNDAGRNIGGENALRMIADGTGGRVLEAKLGASLDAAFAQILRDLRTQYVLTYYPKNLPAEAGPFFPVRVEVLDNGAPSDRMRVAARNGYYGDARKR